MKPKTGSGPLFLVLGVVAACVIGTGSARVAHALEQATPKALPTSEAPSPALAPYFGPGELFVLDDGRIVASLQDDGANDLGFRIETEDALYLVHNRQGFSLATDAANPDAAETRDGALSMRVALRAGEGTQAKAVLHIVGVITITDEPDGRHTLTAENDAGDTFVLSFDVVRAHATDPLRANCDADCGDHGRCRCSGYLICWCFCGLGGTPHCIGVTGQPSAMAYSGKGGSFPVVR